MKLLPKLLLALILSPILPLSADDGNPNLMSQNPNPATDNTGSNMVADYLLNLGLYLGYNIAQKPSIPLPTDPFIRTLMLAKDDSDLATSLVNGLLGALPVNSLIPQFLPKGDGSSFTNAFANAAFTLPAAPFTAPDPNKISINPAVDQLEYQKDPVNQSIVNTLGTVDPHFCGQDLSKEQLDKCSFLYPNKILSNVVGKLPPATANLDKAFYGPNYIRGLLGQLNSNSLLGPLRYSSDPMDTSSTVSVGLSATSQAAQAQNFIRYASGSTVPLKTISYKDYDTLFTNADLDDVSKLTDPASLAKKSDARETLNSYFANLRTYSARTSVGISNLYYILSKRMEQTMPGNKAGSQAQTEFNMATRRLMNDPNEKVVDPNKKTWIEQINNATPATVEKEIALLLAEINYQMYLNRQQEERMLLTQSIILLLNAQPPSNAVTQTAIPSMPRQQ